MDTRISLELPQCVLFLSVYLPPLLQVFRICLVTDGSLPSSGVMDGMKKSLGIGLYGYWSVWVLVCMGIGLCGYWSVWVLVCVGNGLYGYWSVWVLVCVGILLED